MEKEKNMIVMELKYLMVNIKMEKETKEKNIIIMVN